MKRKGNNIIKTLRTRVRKYPAVKVLVIYLIVAIFHPFIANERPLYCKIGGQHYFPAWRGWLYEMEILNWYDNLDDYDWTEKEYEYLVRAPIPYSYHTIDKRNSGFKSPFDQQAIRHWNERHWLGTDILGRDVLAGMLKGTEIAVKIGFFAVFLAVVAALLVGIMAAYSVRFPISLSWWSFILLLILSTLFVYSVWVSLHTSPLYFLLCLLIYGLAIWVFARLGSKYKSPEKLKVRLPVDAVVQRILEAMKAIPTMIFMLACIAVFETINITGLILILAFIMWPGMARYVRAESLKLFNMDYITAAKAYGAKGPRIVRIHILPKLFSSLSVLIAFAVGVAIMVEATLSFLGIGIPIEQVSWGALLKEAKVNFSAWWLAIFPGMALFLLIYNLNLLGDQIQRRKQNDY